MKKQKKAEIIIPSKFQGEELEAVAELLTMPEPELMKVPFEKRKMLCCEKDCLRGPTAYDFGISPLFYIGHRWYNLEWHVFFCPKHKDMLKGYKADAILPENEYIKKYKSGSAIKHIK